MTHSQGVGAFFGRRLVGSWLLNLSLGTGTVKRLGIFIASAGCCCSSNVGGNGWRMEEGFVLDFVWVTKSGETIR